MFPAQYCKRFFSHCLLNMAHTQAFTSLPLSFLRLFGLVLYWIKSKFAATPRAKARVWSEQRYEFGTEVQLLQEPLRKLMQSMLKASCLSDCRMIISCLYKPKTTSIDIDSLKHALLILAWSAASKAHVNPAGRCCLQRHQPPGPSHDNRVLCG